MNTGCVVGQTRERLPTLPFPEAAELRMTRIDSRANGDFARGVLQPREIARGPDIQVDAGSMMKATWAPKPPSNVVDRQGQRNVCQWRLRRPACAPHGLGEPNGSPIGGNLQHLNMNSFSI